MVINILSEKDGVDKGVDCVAADNRNVDLKETGEGES